MSRRFGAICDRVVRGDVFELALDHYPRNPRALGETIEHGDVSLVFCGRHPWGLVRGVFVDFTGLRKSHSVNGTHIHAAHRAKRVTQFLGESPHPFSFGRHGNFSSASIVGTQLHIDRSQYFVQPVMHVEFLYRRLRQ